MHGLTSRDGAGSDFTGTDPASLWQRLTGLYRRYRPFVLFVLLPTALVAGYYYFWAADQYESEAHFLVHRAGSNAVAGTSVAQIVGLTGSNSEREAMSVADYLISHDAVAALDSKLDLTSIFRRPESDVISRLRYSDPEPERLLDFYRDQVTVHHAADTGITTVKARSFRPEDSHAVIKLLLTLGEQRVNTLNERAYQDAVAVSERQLKAAEDNLAEVQLALTNFRQTKRDLDPLSSGQAQSQLVSSLEASLADARAQLTAMGSHISPSSPQYVALASRIRAIQAQIGSQSARLTGGAGAIAEDLGAYEKLQLRQEFAAARYSAAAAALEKARQDAVKQQLFIARVVEPNMPVHALYPERTKIVATVFFVLLVCYGVGWLIVAGVKEHAS